MKLLDVNLLVYAHREDAPDHARYYEWLMKTLGGEEGVAVSELVLSGFLRIVTHPKIFNPPSSLDATVFQRLGHSSLKPGCHRNFPAHGFYQGETESLVPAGGHKNIGHPKAGGTAFLRNKSFKGYIRQTQPPGQHGQHGEIAGTTVFGTRQDDAAGRMDRAMIPRKRQQKIFTGRT